MTKFKVTKHFQALPPWQQTGARIQLTHWLKKEGHVELAGHVCAASSNKALSPHLAEVDKVLPTEVTREQIFPKVFTDPLTIRQELTAMIGQSVRRYPKGSTEGEFSVEDRIAILSELKDQIEEVGKRSKFTREVGRFLTSDRESQDYEDKLDALVIEAGGYLTGLKGTELDETIVDVSKEDTERVVDANIYGALSFLDVVERQEIRASGLMTMQEQAAMSIFLKGTGKVWDRTPKFIETLSRYWGKVTSERMGSTSDELSENIGQSVSQITEPRLRLGIAARLPKSRLIKRLHLFEVEKFIYARGWLKGHIEHNEGQGVGEWVTLLKDNVLSILIWAIKTRNPGYVVRAAEALPEIVDAIAAKAKQLDVELAKVLLSNRRTIIGHALISGKLKKYPPLVFKALPKIIDAIAANKARELDEDLAAILLSNEATIINRALHSGKLEEYPSAVFEALPKMADAIAAKASELDEDLAKLLLSNRGSIIYRAINSGKLKKYLPAVFEALPRIVDKIESKVDELDKEVARAFMSHRGTIISRAIYSGMFEKYPQLVFEALPKMVNAIESKAAELDEELAEILLSNRGSIINHALASGKLEKYLPVVFKTFTKMMDTIEAMANELDSELAEIFLSNRRSIISHALHSGKLEKHPRAISEALPKMVDAIEAKAKELDEDLADIFLSNKGSIIYYAILSVRLEEYIEAVFEALPRMAQAMDRTSLCRAISHGWLDV
jgi:hypothetical protein